LENAEKVTYLEAKASDDKVHQGEGDVGEADIHVHPFVEQNYQNTAGDVENDAQKRRQMRAGHVCVADPDY